MRKKIITGGLAALLGAGIAWASQPADIPSHTERIAYLEQNLGGVSMDYTPDFERAIFVNEDPNYRGVGAQTERNTLVFMVDQVISKKPFDYRLLSVRDMPQFENDGTVDMVRIITYKGDTMYKCDLWADDLPDEMQQRINDHYEVSTEAAYRALTEGKDAYEGLVGDREFEELLTLCD